jgi:hypothetical protein
MYHTAVKAVCSMARYNFGIIVDTFTPPGPILWETWLLAASLLSVRPSARPPAWNRSACTGRTIRKFAHEDQYIFLIISRSVFPRMRIFSDERCRANQNTYAKFSNIFPKIVPWKNNVEPDRPQKTMWRMHISWSIPKATNTNSEFVILIALPVARTRLNVTLHAHRLCSLLCK